ncbi:MAG: hypothetical protein GXP51_02165 [Deltaproteobacteria bacterium]|nr:hypothetical protein [Deltaproteobacteria bacterium]
MPFFTEPAAYHKTALSDLQGAWQNLRDAVVEHHPFPEWERLLFHIDEGMSWESVRDLKHMRKILLLVSNLVALDDVPQAVREWAAEVQNDLDEVFEALAEGEIC